MSPVSKPCKHLVLQMLVNDYSFASIIDLLEIVGESRPHGPHFPACEELKFSHS